ncbi:hypothetical protein [Paenibacillus daejeonensis]|uniref:hypothetical protein n=1 Tax=Paenibacillus daejeonensis TaxID=135193 RepID=UPI000364D32C|nr:hypothetical protein [Paenibacillus daejeonensis]
MTDARKLDFMVAAYMFVLLLLGRLIFIYPNQRYLYILNHDDFYVLSFLFIIASALMIHFFMEGSKKKKLLSLFVATCIIYAGVGAYYYANLPAYTYEEAVEKVEAYERKAGKTVQVQLPEGNYQKLGIGDHTFLKMTDHVYYIYLEVEGEPVSYRFYPLDGQFEHSTRSLVD